MTDIIVDKLVEHNKIVGADVFASEKNGSNDVWSGILENWVWNGTESTPFTKYNQSNLTVDYLAANIWI